MPYILHLRETCGPEVYVLNRIGEQYLKNPEALLALKLKVSPDFLEGQDPDVAVLGPAIYKNYAEINQRALVLGVGASFMEKATPEEVCQRVCNYLEVGARNGRFALYLCNLSAATPPENIRVAVDTAHGWNH